MKVQSLRFGEIDVPDDKVISMIRPILGFEKLRTFCLIEVDELKPLLWFQSTEDEAISFLVINPRLLVPDYGIKINSNEIKELNVEEVSSVETYTVVTVPEDNQEISVNLQGPILINTENNRAKQLVLVNSGYEIQQKISQLQRVPELDDVTEELVPA